MSKTPDLGTKPTPSHNTERTERRVYMVIAGYGICALLLMALIAWRLGVVPTTGEEAGFKNVLIVTFDTTRADRVGAYGHRKAHTPNIDQMARVGVTFDRAMAVAPITLPSHTSILTGLYPNHHGARNNGTHNVAESVTTMAEILEGEGFATGAVVSAMVLDSKYGLDQGFDMYDDNLANADKAPMFMFRETKAKDTAERALTWIKDRGSERWFLWVHFFDPHAGHIPPPEYARLCPDSLYDAEIAYADAGLGEVIEGLRMNGMLKETLVVMTADHGEALGDHGESTHSMFIYDSTIHVPLVMMHPGLARQHRIREVVSSVDIMPTSLVLLGVDYGGQVDGRSLAGAMLDPFEKVEARPVYSEAMSPFYNHGWSDIRGVRGERQRYIRSPIPEAYDFRKDPRELKNLLPGRQDLADWGELALDTLMGDLETDVRGDDIRSMDPEQRQALAALGYVWSPLDEEVEEGAILADPKEKVHLWERSQYAHGLVRAERYDEAEKALREVLAEDPAATLSRGALVDILAHQEKFDEAHALLGESLMMPGVRTGTWVRMAALEREMDLDTWPTFLAGAKKHDPRDPMPWVREGDWAQEAEDSVAAIAAYRKAIELDDRSAKAWIGIGNTEHRLGREQEALDALDRATAADPIAVEAWYNLGVVYEALNRSVDARKNYEQALRCDEGHVLTLVNLGNICTRDKDDPAAESLYLRAVKSSAKNNADDFGAIFNLGLLYLRTKQPGRAAVAFKQALEIEPGDIRPARTLLIAGVQSRNLEAVKQAAHLANTIEPNSVALLVDAALALGTFGEEQSYRGYLDRALVLSEDNLKGMCEKRPKLRVLLER
ncbi:MAG: sulfatase-like hydrolase/transferase [Planctomycetota bacterium]|nr:sulfatase-like hydrolase/transferase [Planctomycetota bacterium]